MTTEKEKIMSKETLLIIPAYNEEMNIGKVLDDLNGSAIREQFDVLVINDGSRDSTIEVARKHGITVLPQVFNLGYGAALQSGYKYAADNDYRYVLQMDADGQHDVRNLEIILKRLKGESEPSGLPQLKKKEDRIPDIVIGSRFLKGAETFKISGLKAFAIGLFNKAITITTGYQLTDPTSGLQGLNRRTFTYYARFTNFDIQYPDLNMIIQMLLKGFHIEEVPAIMHERMAGVSMHTGLIHSAQYMVIMAVSTLNILNQNRKTKNKKTT